MSELVTVLKKLLRDVTLFTRYASGLKLRAYQEQVARVIVESVLQRKGAIHCGSPFRSRAERRSSSQIETYILTLLSQLEAEIVKVSPTGNPKQDCLASIGSVSPQLLTRERWKKESGYIYRVGPARIFFLSARPQPTWRRNRFTLLECDDAQDVLTPNGLRSSPL
jgi:hypothetical protein